MGGLAISDQFGTPWQVGRTRRDPQRDLIISLAGPLTQVASAALVASMIWGLARSQSIPVTNWEDLIVAASVVLGSHQLTMFVVQYLYVSVVWALLNLLPVFPLDGGQISRNLFLMFGGSNAVAHSLMLSIAAGAAAALYGFTHQQPFLGMLFAMLAYGSYQALEQYRGGFGGWRY
jgi:Zn-dependent protease